ncbi:MAG: hypothetical protein JJU46_14700 [Balneolaceae bacterium]|nr:hypothetical protein [Balneolaceae bacterium]MCH8549580.1 hypothetical protein [Balneolaceae bacterium]
MHFKPNLIEKVGKRYGSSFYLVDKKLFESNLTGFRSAFARIYPKVVIAYSFKTNYIPTLCRIAREKDALAEVVSGLEYEIAEKTGFSGDRIIFNGPLKEKSELYKAFHDGAIVQFDSYEEVEVLKSFLNDFPKETVKCALRCNFDIGENNRSRFGFDVENGEAERVYAELFSLKGCRPVGIHCHFSTRHRSLNSFRVRTEKLIQLATSIFSEQSHKLEYINIGGGFFGKMPDKIKAQFSVDIPSYNEYAYVIGNLMKDKFPEGDVTLIIEPGAAVVANTMSYFCRVHSIKMIESRPVVTITGSIHNIRPTLTSIDIPFRVIKGSGRKKKVENAIIGGYTCLESDVISRSFSGDIGVGDYLGFENMGAYNIVFKPPFIKSAPPVLMVQNGESSTEVELIRKQETIDMFLATYIC